VVGLLHFLAEKRHIFSHQHTAIQKWCQILCYHISMNLEPQIKKKGHNNTSCTHNAWTGPCNGTMLNYVGLYADHYLLLTVHVSTQMTSSITASQKKRGSFLQHNALWRQQFTKFIFVHYMSKSLWNVVVSHEWNSTFAVSHANGTDIPVCCARCANSFLGTAYNVVLISSSFSSANIFCMISYCLKHNKLLKILILICKLLSLMEMVHPETVVSICDGTSSGNYI